LQLVKLPLYGLSLRHDAARRTFQQLALRVTPAMEAGITDHVWKVEEIVALLEKK
jgi:hypothetical protein